VNVRTLSVPCISAAFLTGLALLFASPFANLRAMAQPTGASASQDSSSTAAAAPETGPYYALVIGNDDYRTLPKLKTAANDATAVAQVLRDQYGFSTSLLLNATRADIITALLTYRRKLPEKSNLLIYYAGHGANDSEAKVAYWLPVDAQLGNTTNWISSDDITSELRVIKAMHILVVADSCYSGALMRSADLIDVNAEVKPDERDFYLEKLQGLKSRNLVASGGVEPVADGGTVDHSIFAAVLLQSLQNMSERKFTTSLLFQRLVVRVAGRSQQTPQYSPIVNSEHDGGDFVFMRQPGKTPPPSLCCSPQTVAATASDTRLAPTPLAPARATPTTSNGALGKWMQPNGPTNNSLGRVVIEVAGDAVTMHAFGNCKYPICDWGAQPAVFDGRNTTATFTLHATAANPRIAKVTVHPVANGLDVIVDNVTTGPSGPDKKLAHRTFIRQ